jgi:hypothetical protein
MPTLAGFRGGVELLLLYHLPLGGIFFFGKTPAGFHLGSGGKGGGAVVTPLPPSIRWYLLLR